MAESKDAVENDLIKLLQTDGKGWNYDLFENENEILHALCKHCGCVCMEAVELGCEHEDKDIYLYCNKCLKNIIRNNNRNCPINNHLNPIICRNRSIRRLISKCVILCPYSVKYKQKMIFKNRNIENDQIIDTNNNFDEQEGINAPKITLGCNFKGTIDNLLKNHIFECVKIYNQNINENKYKKKISDLNKQIKNLTNKINELANQNQKINEQYFKSQNESNQKHQIFDKQIKISKQTNKNLQKELKITNDKIINLNKVIMEKVNENQTLKHANEKLANETMESNDKVIGLQIKLNGEKEANKETNKLKQELYLIKEYNNISLEVKHCTDHCWYDIANGQISKKILVSANDLLHDIIGPDCEINCTYKIYYIENYMKKTLCERKQFNLIVDDDDRFCDAFHVAIQSMRQGEQSIFKILDNKLLNYKEIYCDETELKTNEFNNNKRQAPSNKLTYYEINVHECEQPEQILDFHLVGKVSKAVEYKYDGNDLFAQGRLFGAKVKYKKALKWLDFEFRGDNVLIPQHNELFVGCNNNLALVYFKMKHWLTAIEHCDIVLGKDENNLKALTRRGASRLELKLFVLSKKDLKKVLSLDKNNSYAKKLLKMCKKKHKEYVNTQKVAFLGN